MERRHILRIVFMLFMLQLVIGKRSKTKSRTRYRTSICRGYTFCSCYRATQKRVEIYCFGTKSLEPIYNLLVSEFKNTTIKKLYLRADCYLTSLPSYAFDNCTIQRFSSQCPFSNIEPDAFTGVQELTAIDLANTAFSEVPESLMNLQYVETLNIKYHSLQSLDGQWNISSLKRLNVQHGILDKLSSLATFTHTPNLEYIDFTNNSLTYISPEVFSNLEVIDQIYLGNNLITSAEDIFKENNPTVMDLKYNRLTSLNNVFHEGMDRLQTLDISGNRFPKIDYSTFGRKLEKLKYFYMAYCDCANINMSFPEQFPRVKAVNLGFNNLHNLPTYIFRNHNSIVTLDLQVNSITCDEILFDEMPRLRTLTLDHNNISGIGDCFRHLQVLEKLELSHNQIRRIQDRDFNWMLQLKSLTLAYNSIEFIGSNSFMRLRYLKTLELSHNRIHQLNGSLRYVTTLERVMLNSCYLQKLTASDFYKVQKITVLDLSDNELVSVDDAFQSFTELLYLNLANNRLTTISRKTLPEKIKLQELRLAQGNEWNCDYQLLWLFEWLSDTNYTVLKDSPSCTLPRKQEGKTFHGVSMKKNYELEEECPSPCHCEYALNRSDFYLTADCSRKNITLISKSLPTNLGVLNLSENEMTTINVSANLKRLFNLNLEHNRINSFEIDSFEVLQELRLSYNKLSRPPKILMLQNRLEVVTLSNNPWICDCKTGPFRDWLAKNQEKVIDLDEVKCDTLRSFRGLSRKAIHLLQDSDLCPTWIYVGLAIGFTCLALVLLLIVCLRYRHHLKSSAYACGLACIKEEDKDMDSVYDAFLSYNWMDEQFVFSNIIPGLQDKVPNFALCIPNRDVYGAHSNALIAQEVEKSKRIVVLLNQNYINDENSMAEFRLAYDLCSEDRMKRLIFIKNGRVPRAKELDRSVKCALNSSVCVSWGEKFFWERLRYAMPKKKNVLNLRSMGNLEEHEEHEDAEPLVNPE